MEFKIVVPNVRYQECYKCGRWMIDHIDSDLNQCPQCKRDWDKVVVNEG